MLCLWFAAAWYMSGDFAAIYCGMQGNTVRIRCNSCSQAAALLQQLHKAQNFMLSLPQMSSTSLVREQVQKFLMTVDPGQLSKSMQPISSSAGSKPAVVCPAAVKEEVRLGVIVYALL